jgi:CheY-like chemotaxis protein
MRPEQASVLPILPLMKRVLVLEPDAEVRTLYQRAIERLGHAATFADDGGLDALPEIDAVLVEPGSPLELGVARDLRAQRPDVPIVCASIFPAQGFGVGPTAGFGLEPVAFLEKPFRLGALEDALRLALTGGLGAPLTGS